MFSWFDRLFPKKKKSSCCSKNTCGTPSVWNKPQDLDDAGEYVANTMVINTIANSICMDQGHPMYCPSEDSSPASDSGSSCCSSTVSDGPMPDCSPSCCDSDCSASCDSGSSCCDSGCSSSD
jgi:hypothetical protein